MMIGVPQVMGMKPMLTSVFSGLPTGSAANAFNRAKGKMSATSALSVAAPRPSEQLGGGSVRWLQAPQR